MKNNFKKVIKQINKKDMTIQNDVQYFKIL